MANYIITRTEVAPVDVYLSQKLTEAELLASIRTEGLFNSRQVQLWEFKPSSHQHGNGMGLLTLNCIGDNNSSTAAEMYLRKALYYARLDGHRDEVDVLRNFQITLDNNLADAIHRKERHTAEAKPTGN